jgi:protein subunit release factor A
LFNLLSSLCRAKLHEAEHQKQAATLSAQRTAAGGSGNANERIRSYNYQDGRVSDHRVGVTLQVRAMWLGLDSVKGTGFRVVLMLAS